MKEIIKKRKRPCVLWIALLISQPFGLAHTKKERNSTLFQLPDRFSIFFQGCQYWQFVVNLAIFHLKLRPKLEVGPLGQIQKAK